MENIKIIKKMEKEFFIMEMEENTMVNGKKEKKMEMEFFILQMVKFMMVNG